MGHWAQDAVFYQFYPLGTCGAPQRNDFRSAPVARLENLKAWTGHLRDLGINAVYLGPVFESGSHGYDTADFFTVDRRLGSNDTLAGLVDWFHRNGMRVILDGVFHHVGREFWAFRDVREKRDASPFAGWFHGLDFRGTSPYGDPFSYAGWDGHYDLVKLEQGNEEVCGHLFGAVERWIQEFGIDGLRLDVADRLEPEFLRKLSGFCRSRRSDFWLMGEVVHGDYRKWAAPGLLDSVTNYECYKGLYSSHVDRNYFEIAYSLTRQFGRAGLYNNIPLYNFVDNHDVTRIADTLKNSAHLFPLHCLLFSMPGVPSLYYGSDWGVRGRKRQHDDWGLRPCIRGEEIPGPFSRPPLTEAIGRLAALRHASRALKEGNYEQLHVSHEQLAFYRQAPGEGMVVVINASDAAVPLELRVPFLADGPYEDVLNHQRVDVRGGLLRCEAWPCWGRMIRI